MNERECEYKAFERILAMGVGWGSGYFLLSASCNSVHLKINMNFLYSQGGKTYFKTKVQMYLNYTKILTKERIYKSHSYFKRILSSIFRVIQIWRLKFKKSQSKTRGKYFLLPINNSKNSFFKSIYLPVLEYLLYLTDFTNAIPCLDHFPQAPTTNFQLSHH